MFFKSATFEALLELKVTRDFLKENLRICEGFLENSLFFIIKYEIFAYDNKKTELTNPENGINKFLKLLLLEMLSRSTGIISRSLSVNRCLNTLKSK